MVEPDQERNWVARTTKIALALGSQFGTPHQGSKGDFVTCVADADGCMQDPNGRVEFLWRWPDGHRITLVTKANHPYPPLTTVTYLAAPQPKTLASHPALAPAEANPASQSSLDAGSGGHVEDAGAYLDGGTT